MQISRLQPLLSFTCRLSVSLLDMLRRELANKDIIGVLTACSLDLCAGLVQLSAIAPWKMSQ